MHDNIVASAASSVPPVSVTAAIIAGIDLPHVVMALTGVYTTMQICWFVYEKLFKKHRGNRK